MIIESLIDKNGLYYHLIHENVQCTTNGITVEFSILIAEKNLTSCTNFDSCFTLQYLSVPEWQYKV